MLPHMSTRVSPLLSFASFALIHAACGLKESPPMDANTSLEGNQSAPSASNLTTAGPDANYSSSASEINASVMQDDNRSSASLHHRKTLPSPKALAKLPPDGGPEYNRLVFEQSPYLLQHAGNPIDWFPWGEEAFAKAKKEDKPIFLSVGYTTCHWCHVMERESFEDQEVADLMNELYICVKVDREERPDVDNVYMTVTQMMTGSGGWPMTVVMTPEKVPFFAGTYYPKKAMLELLPHFADVWKNQRPQVFAMGKAVIQDLARVTSSQPGGDLNASRLQACYDSLSSSYDGIHGGFGRRPKFPTAHNLSFLLRHHARTGEPKALRMVETTLRKIRLGGVYDHIGLGIHRYSTDERWLLPHFEKMLYDQALFALANLECHQVTGKEQYARVAREIFTYVLRDMTAPSGGFYSAEDADSEGEEGKFYVWTQKEIADALGEEDAAFFGKIYNFTTDGNFLDEATHQKTGANVPHLTKRLYDHAADLGLELHDLENRVETLRGKLFQIRKQRIHPQKDDKILTDWNGLMISAFSKGGRILRESRYLETATAAADYALATLRRPDGRLLKRSRNGKAGLPAHLEDYAFLIQGLLDLYEAAFHHRHLQAAIELTDLAVKHFADKAEGGFFLTADDGEKLLVRAKEVYDGAIPSGNSVMAMNLLRLARITGSETYQKTADQLFAAFAGFVERSPSGCDVLLSALDFALGPTLEIVVAGKRGDPATEALLAHLHTQYLPNKVLLFRSTDVEKPPIATIAPFLENQGLVQGKPAAYVCKNQACELPVTTPQALAAILVKALGKEEKK